MQEKKDGRILGGVMRKAQHYFSPAGFRPGRAGWLLLALAALGLLGSPHWTSGAEPPTHTVAAHGRFPLSAPKLKQKYYIIDIN